MFLNNNIWRGLSIAKGHAEGAHNFDMQKSEYVPILNLIGSHFAWEGELSTFSADEAIKVNKYLDVLNTSWGNRTVSYFDILKRFTTLVNGFENFKCNLNILVPRKDIGFLKTVSFNRFANNKPQIVGNLGYKFNNQLGVTWYDDTEKETIVYLLAFKTKYLVELQRALIQGKPFHNTWFKLFIAPEIPGLMDKRGYFKKPFANQFIIPYEESHFEIEYKHNFIEDISFKEVPSIDFQALTGTRAIVTEKKELLLKEFILSKQFQLQLQKDWETGIHSDNVAFTQLQEYRAEKAFKLLVEVVDKEYYLNIPLIEGMRRSFSAFDNTRSEIFFDGNWVLYKGRLHRSDANRLVMLFKTLYNPDVEEVNIEKENIITECSVYGQRVSYKEGNCYSDSIITRGYYKVNNLTLNFSDRGTGNHPDTLIMLDDLTTIYYFDKENFIYRTTNALAKIDYFAITHVLDMDIRPINYNSYRARVVLGITEILYIIEEDRFYFSFEGCLLQVYNTPVLDVSKLVGDTSLVEIVKTITLRGTSLGGSSGGNWLYTTPIIGEETIDSELSSIDDLFDDSASATTDRITLTEPYITYGSSTVDLPVTISDADSVQGEPIVAHQETDTEYMIRTGVNRIPTNAESLPLPTGETNAEYIRRTQREDEAIIEEAHRSAAEEDQRADEAEAQAEEAERALAEHDAESEQRVVFDDLDNTENEG